MIKDQTSCQCEKCQECCTREPGWFLPEEIPVAARFLELSEQEFVAHYCQEHRLEEKVALSPATKLNSTTCIFFEEGQCQIQPVKPYECRKVFGCEPARRHKRIRELIMQKWC